MSERRLARQQRRATRITEAERVELAKVLGQVAKHRRAHDDAITRLNYLSLTIRERYGLADGDRVDADTGQITRGAASGGA